MNEQYSCINLGRNINTGCQNIYWDLKGGLKSVYIPDQIKTIIHCASIVGENRSTNDDYLDINVQSTLQLLELCEERNITHFVYISSGAVYGFKKRKCMESDHCYPQGFYGLSKYFSELLCKQYSGPIKICILRLFFPYGVNQANGLMPNLINKIIHNQIIELNVGGKPCINPVNIVDVCNILNQIIDEEITGIFNIAGTEVFSIIDICELLKQKLGQKYQLAYNENFKQVKNLIGSNYKICKELNYNFQMNFTEGLDQILEHI